MEFFTSLFMDIPAYQERYIGAVPQPVLSVSLSADGTYAFVEFATEELASTALEFDKGEFLGRPLKVGRPGKMSSMGFQPAMDVLPLRMQGRIPSVQPAWLAGKGLGPAAVQMAQSQLLGKGPGGPPGPANAGPSSEKRKREIFIGNLAKDQVSPLTLRDLFTPACEHLPQYIKTLGPPINDVILAPDGLSAFVEFQNENLAGSIIPIFDNMELLGTKLAVCKPEQHHYAEMHLKMHQKAMDDGHLPAGTPPGPTP